MNTRPLSALLAGLATLASARTALAQAPSTAPQLNLPITPGPFQGTMASLTNYRCPDWFRDAKFGIWAHWVRRPCRWTATGMPATCTSRATASTRIIGSTWATPPPTVTRTSSRSGRPRSGIPTA